MSRKLARERAFMFLYSLEIQTEDYALQRELFLKEWRLSRADTDFFDLVVNGVIKHKDELDEEIGPRLVGWVISRVPRIDLTILRLALFEMKYLEDVPTSVSISEAVILAGKYSEEKSRSYINAVLGNLEREGNLSALKIEPGPGDAPDDEDETPAFAPDDDDEIPAFAPDDEDVTPAPATDVDVGTPDTESQF